MKNYYKILGVREFATVNEINLCFHNLRIAAQTNLAIEAAFKVLSNAAEKAVCDFMIGMSSPQALKVDPSLRKRCLSLSEEYPWDELQAARANYETLLKKSTIIDDAEKKEALEKLQKTIRELALEHFISQLRSNVDQIDQNFLANLTHKLLYLKDNVEDKIDRCKVIKSLFDKLEVVLKTGNKKRKKTPARNEIIEFFVSQLNLLIQADWYFHNISYPPFFKNFLLEAPKNDTNAAAFKELFNCGVITKNKVFGLEWPVLSDFELSIRSRDASSKVGKEAIARLKVMIKLLHNVAKADAVLKQEKNNAEPVDEDGAAEWLINLAGPKSKTQKIDSTSTSAVSSFWLPAPNQQPVHNHKVAMPAIEPQPDMPTQK